MPKKKEVKKVGAVKTPKAPKTPKLEFQLEVQVNDVNYKGSAITLYDALMDFTKSPQFPFAIKSRCLIRYSNGKVQKQVVWPALRAHRQFRLLKLKPTQAQFQADKWLSDLAN